MHLKNLTFSEGVLNILVVFVSVWWQKSALQFVNAGQGQTTFTAFSGFHSSVKLKEVKNI